MCVRGVGMRRGVLVACERPLATQSASTVREEPSRVASPGPDPFMCVMCAGLPDAARSGRGRRRDVAYVLCR